ncbi:MAG: MFS transporter [bacterium]
MTCAQTLPWWHARFNLLATRRGRLTAFFFLYLTEGIPTGFALVAMVTQMRRLGISPEDIGVFAAAFNIPWALKWVMGPVIDLCYSDRLGRRRVWIVGAQVLMCLVLMMTMAVDLGTQIKLLSALIILHNVFAATQDVAIDALACGTLAEHERGTANGLMFAGAYCGQAVGGAGVLYLLSWGFPLYVAFFFVIGSILTVTLVVSLRLREPLLDPGAPLEGPRLKAVALALHRYCKDARQAFFGTRAAAVGLVVALLPMGPYSLSLALANNLSVELGMGDGLIAKLTLLSTLVSALACVLGGYMSDRFGRKRMLSLYIVGTAVPTVLLAWGMHQQNWIFPVAMDLADRPVASTFLLALFIGTSMAYALFQGLLYGTRTALFMDVCKPAVAATQFTAYMALMNVVLGYSTYWQCRFISRLGYPATLLIDAGLGLACLILLPFMTKHQEEASLKEAGPEHA